MLGWIGLGIAVVAIPLSWYFGRRTRRRPRIRVLVDYDVLVGESERLTGQGLDLRFRDAPVQTLSRTILAVWHDGGDPIRNNIVKSDPLRVVLGGGDAHLFRQPSRTP